MEEYGLYEEPGRLAFAQGLLESKIKEYLSSYREKKDLLDAYFDANKLAVEYDEEFKNVATTNLGNIMQVPLKFPINKKALTKES